MSEIIYREIYFLFIVFVSLCSLLCSLLTCLLNWKRWEISNKQRILLEKEIRTVMEAHSNAVQAATEACKRVTIKFNSINNSCSNHYVGDRYPEGFASMESMPKILNLLPDATLAERK